MLENVRYQYGMMANPVVLYNRTGICIDVDFFKRVYNYTIAFTKSGKIGIAICHPNDQFVKKTGREIALRRLNEKPIELGVQLCVSEFDTFNRLEEIAESIIKLKVKYTELVTFEYITTYTPEWVNKIQEMEV